MISYINQKKGQSTLEYAVLIILIIAALLTFQNYIKRGITGRLKSSTDDIGDQFSPGNTNAVIATKTSSNTKQTFTGGVQRTDMITPEITNKVARSAIINVDQEYYGQ